MVKMPHIASGPRRAGIEPRPRSGGRNSMHAELDPTWPRELAARFTVTPS
jgi:hypothetical protein